MNEKNSKVAWEYEIEINCLLRSVYKDFSPELPAQKSERILMEKLNEVNNLYNLTKNEEYKEVFNNSFKRYGQIIGKGAPRNSKLIELKDMLSDSTTIHSEEIDMELLMRRDAIIETVKK